MDETAKETRRAIYRIWPSYVRSAIAHESWKAHAVIDVPWVTPSGEGMRARELACSAAHAQVLRQFLSTPDSHCVVLEDDVFLLHDAWLGYREFDYFLPFSNHRDATPGTDFTIQYGVLPKFGSQAAVVSRQFAEACLPLLDAGVIADHADRRIPGMQVGCYRSNAVLHDLEAHSLICDQRRLVMLQNPPRAARVVLGEP